jgi:hypothetical protein
MLIFEDGCSVPSSSPLSSLKNELVLLVFEQLGCYLPSCHSLPPSSLDKLVFEQGPIYLANKQHAHLRGRLLSATTTTTTLKTSVTRFRGYLLCAAALPPPPPSSYLENEHPHS